MNTLVQNTAKLATAAFLAVLVTGLVGLAINSSSYNHAARAADQDQEAHVVQAAAPRYS